MKEIESSKGHGKMTRMESIKNKIGLIISNIYMHQNLYKKIVI